MFKFYFKDIIGESEIIKSAIHKANILKDSKSNIIIYGESGTGKDLFARSIHYESKRSKKAYLPVNCSAIPDNLIESILFGYTKGAFTGADSEGKKGIFEAAEGGTVFLDEISDMPPLMQAKLLRCLETKTIQRIGDTEYIKVDFRLICATNRELHEMVDNNLFRKDLLYRINVAPIRIPTLRERSEDLHIFIEHFINKFKDINENHVTGISDETKELLISYQWSGNVRELENTIEYACNFCRNGIIQIEDLPLRFRSDHRNNPVNKEEKIINNMNLDVLPLDILEKKEITKAFEIYSKEENAIAIIASKLNISVSTLYRKIKRYNLTV